MPKNGVFTPFKPLKPNPTPEPGHYGVPVTQPNLLKKHSEEVARSPVCNEVDGNILLYGWEWTGKNARLFQSNHTWCMKKIYHTYKDGEQFVSFWNKTSYYCRPLRCLYCISYGNTFPSLSEIFYGGRNEEIYEIVTDGNGGFTVLSRDMDGNSNIELQYETEQTFSEKGPPLPKEYR